jgi:transposase
MKMKTLQTKRHLIDGKIIIGIDPSKKKNQAVVLDPKGIPMGNSFSFQSTYEGFNEELWRKLKLIVKDPSPDTAVFAIEASINFWQKLSYFLKHKGFTVLLVNPLTTKYERKRFSRNFSRTDPRDALMVANAARDGYFHFYREFSPESEALHRLAITYDKLKKQLVTAKQRLLSQTELIFPEIRDIMDLDTDSARYLLSKAMTPQDFKTEIGTTEASRMAIVSRRHYGAETVVELKKAADHCIGIPLPGPSYGAERLTMNIWLQHILVLRLQLGQILDEMVRLAKQTPWYSILTSVMGISDISASRFIAENRNLSESPHFKKIQAFAGMSLKINDSGEYSGNRHITHIGNPRLRSILYRMTEETKNYVPEVRIRFLKRQMKHGWYTENVVACSSNLLKLIASLIRENRPYQEDPEKIKELKRTERKYQKYLSDKKVA